MESKLRYWEKESPKYNWPHARLLLIAEIIQRAPAGTSVLDLGAGKALLARLIGPSYPYRGLDIVGETASEPSVEACDFDHLEHFHLSGTPYDIVVASGLLEYLENWKSFLRHVTAHWLSPNGLLITSVTNARAYPKAPILKHPAWKNMFSLPQILNEMAELDLSVEGVYPLLWGNKRWGLPLVKALSALAMRQANFLYLDRPWVSQFLLLARPKHNAP